MPETDAGPTAVMSAPTTRRHSRKLPSCLGCTNPKGAARLWALYPVRPPLVAIQVRVSNSSAPQSNFASLLTCNLPRAPLSFVYANADGHFVCPISHFAVFRCCNEVRA